MYFLWPGILCLLLALALLPVAYLWLTGRRSRSAVHFSSLGVVREADAGRRWRRHVPPALLLLAFAALLLAAARPVARVTLPWSRSTIMLAMDVSLSMRVSDVKPTRLEAAQAAAKLFLRELPRGIEVGLVTFAGSSQVAQRPTLDRDALVAGIDGIQMQIGTAIGNAIVQCIAELFPEQHIDLGDLSPSSSNSTRNGRSLDEREKPTPQPVAPVAPGSYPSAAIILLSDGRRTTGVDTLAAAKMAADHGVRVFVVGVGTVEGDVASPEGMAIWMQLDEPTLREVARMTGGEYYHAGEAETLQGVYRDLGTRVQLVNRETELAAPLAMVAALLALAAATLSLLWFGRGPTG